MFVCECASACVFGCPYVFCVCVCECVYMSTRSCTEYLLGEFLSSYCIKLGSSLGFSTNTDLRRSPRTMTSVDGSLATSADVDSLGSPTRSNQTVQSIVLDTVPMITAPQSHERVQHIACSSTSDHESIPFGSARIQHSRDRILCLVRGSTKDSTLVSKAQELAASLDIGGCR